MGSIVLSYREEDTGDIVSRISDRLVQAFGYRAVSKARQDGEPVGLKRLEKAECLVLLIGPDWSRPDPATGLSPLLGSREPLRMTLEAALKLRLEILPVYVGAAGPLRLSQLPAPLFPLRDLPAEKLDAADGFEAGMDRLIGSLRSRMKSHLLLRRHRDPDAEASAEPRVKPPDETLTAEGRKRGMMQAMVRCLGSLGAAAGICALVAVGTAVALTASNEGTGLAKAAAKERMPLAMCLGGTVLCIGLSRFQR